MAIALEVAALGNFQCWVVWTFVWFFTITRIFNYFPCIYDHDDCFPFLNHHFQKIKNFFNAFDLHTYNLLFLSYWFWNRRIPLYTARYVLFTILQSLNVKNVHLPIYSTALLLESSLCLPHTPLLSQLKFLLFFTLLLTMLMFWYHYY